MYSNQFVQLKFLYKNMVNQKLGYSISLTVRLYTFSKLILTHYTRKTPRGVINLHALNDERCLQASWLQLSLITAQGE